MDLAHKSLGRVGMTSTEKMVVFASSLGTVFEWYDFFLVGALASEISRHFFSGVNPTAAFIFTLLSFAAGFAVRPLGAIVFGDLFARTRRPRMLAVIAMLMAMCSALVPFTDTPWTSIAVGSIMIAGGGALYTVVTADVMTRVPPDSVSVVGGLIAAGQSLAIIIVSPIVGSLVETYQSYDVVLWGIAVWIVPGMLVWLLWKPTK